MILTLGKPESKLMVGFKFYGTAIDKDKKIWAWYCSSDMKVHNFKRLGVAGMKLKSTHQNRNFYNNQRLKNYVRGEND